MTTPINKNYDSEVNNLYEQIKNKKIIFQFNQKDTYVKRAALRKGWVENSSYNNNMFHVKWDASDSHKSDIYTQMKSDQFYNHFPHSRELGSK